jgi:hypothetical protein
MKRSLMERKHYGVLQGDLFWQFYFVNLATFGSSLGFLEDEVAKRNDKNLGYFLFKKCFFTFLLKFAVSKHGL